MKNYAVLEGMKRHQKTVLDDAFNKGYEQGYQDGKLDGEAENIEKLEKKLDDEKKAEYKRGYADGKKEVAAELNFEKGYYKGYEDGKTDIVSKAKAEVSQYREGYDKGLKHGQELRAEEVKCAEACGMRKGWETARKILQMTLDEVAKVFDPTWDVEHVIEVMSVSEVITRLEAWEKKQEQTEKNCNNCKYGGNSREQYPCKTCITLMNAFANWTPKQDAPEMNVESIEVGDEVKDNFGNKLLVTHVYSECRNVDTIDTDGRVERFPSECLKKTGRRYCFQELLDAMKSEKPEEG